MELENPNEVIFYQIILFLTTTTKKHVLEEAIPSDVIFTTEQEATSYIPFIVKNLQQKLPDLKLFTETKDSYKLNNKLIKAYIKPVKLLSLVASEGD